MFIKKWRTVENTTYINERIWFKDFWKVIQRFTKFKCIDIGKEMSKSYKIILKEFSLNE